MVGAGTWLEQGGICAAGSFTSCASAREEGWAKRSRVPHHQGLRARHTARGSGSQAGTEHYPMLTVLAMECPESKDVCIFQTLYIIHSGRHLFDWPSRCNKASVGITAESRRHTATGPSFVLKAICQSTPVHLKINVIWKMVADYKRMNWVTEILYPCKQRCRGEKHCFIQASGEVRGVTNLTPLLWAEEHVVAIVLDPVCNDDQTRWFGFKKSYRQFNCCARHRQPQLSVIPRLCVYVMRWEWKAKANLIRPLPQASWVKHSWLLTRHMQASILQKLISFIQTNSPTVA